MRKAIGWVGVVIIVCILVAGFVAYFVTSLDPRTKIAYDGFGRPLCESPWFMHLIFGQDRLWAGWLWFLGDIVIFWGGAGLGINLAGWGFKEKSKRI